LQNGGEKRQKPGFFKKPGFLVPGSLQGLSVNSDVCPGFNPNPRPTAQRLIGAVNYSSNYIARFIENFNLISVSAGLAGLHGNHRLICAFGIGFDVVLVNMNPL
jgi:hypothetical protein